MITGTILHVQRLSTEDGPGIRSTVFLKGCPLQCAWCHNPESISRRMQIQWFSERCIGCRTCIEACPNGCLTMMESGLIIDREWCQNCATCVEACPSGALESLGKTVSVDELLAELLKDRAFYEKSGGGVTLSGGEPTLQPDFIEALLKGLKAHGISTALDTCGLASGQTLKRMLPYTDLVLFDLKLLDDQSHRQWTGMSNRRILANLQLIGQIIQTSVSPTSLWIRTPLIPGATDSDENLLAIGNYLAEHMNGLVSRWELCAFNNLCREQYARLGLEWEFATTPLMTAGELAHCETIARSTNCRPEFVLATGATRVLDTA